MRNNGYNNGERRNNNNRKGGYNNRKNNPFNNAERQQREQKRQEILERQNAELAVINEVMSYLNACVEENNSRITVKDILAYLEENGFNREDTAVKSIGQYNYILLDLAKAVMNPHIDDARVELRVQYIEERLLTAFNRSYHEYILNLFTYYNSLANVHDAENADEEELVEIDYEETDEEVK